MANINIHPIDKSFLTDYCERNEKVSLATHRKFLKDDLGRLQMFASTCASLVSYYFHINPDRTKSIYYFLLYQRSKACYFKMAMAPVGTIERIELNKDWIFNIEAKETRDYINPSSWCDTLARSVIARDKEAIHWLMRFPTERIRKATATSPEYTYLFVDFLKAYYTRQSDVGPRLVASYKATDPSQVWEEYLDIMFKGDTPVMDVWIAYLKNDPVEFNVQLEKALILYREYCAADPKSIYTLI